MHAGNVPAARNVTQIPGNNEREEVFQSIPRKVSSLVEWLFAAALTYLQI